MLAALPRPIVFAHRGASQHAPENTLAAFRLAIEQGAPAIELDVKLTADKQVIVIHDQTVDRTTDGSGRVDQMRFDELRRFDAGSYFDSAFQGEHIPTLAEVFELAAGKVFVNIELTNYATPQDDLPQRVAQVVKDAGMTEKILFSSFNPSTLLRARRLLPHIPLGMLAFSGSKGGLFRSRLFAALFPYQALHPASEDVSERLINQVHKRKQLLNTYTVNDPEEMRRLAGMGVDGFFTDDPALALKIFQGKKRL